MITGPNDDDGYWGVPKWIKHKLQMPEHHYPWPIKVENHVVMMYHSQLYWVYEHNVPA